MPNKGLSLHDARLSDHSPSWEAGYDAVMVTDTSLVRTHHYQGMSDTLDLVFLAAVSDDLLAGLRAF